MQVGKSLMKIKQLYVRFVMMVKNCLFSDTAVPVYSIEKLFLNVAKMLCVLIKKIVSGLTTSYWERDSVIYKEILSDKVWVQLNKINSRPFRNVRAICALCFYRACRFTMPAI